MKRVRARPSAVLQVLAPGAGQALRVVPDLRRAVTSPAMTPRRRRSEAVAARRLNQGAAILALSVLTDSALEHYRGSFQNRAMYAPLIASALSLATSLAASLDERPQPKPGRDVVYGVATAVGAAGLGFHLYNVLKRPSGLSWLNLFYSAPIGAPGALILTGLLGAAAERVGQPVRGRRIERARPRLGRVVALLSAAGIAGAVGEAGLLHFRGAFQNPAMVLPLTAPPVASALLAASAFQKRGPRRLARWWLKLTALLGVIGSGFHAYGVSRNMGGWRNWSQNALNGPPLPAPPSFAGAALAGLAALTLIENESNV
jgi:hypothetical protein